MKHKLRVRKTIAASFAAAVALCLACLFDVRMQWPLTPRPKPILRFPPSRWLDIMCTAFLWYSRYEVCCLAFDVGLVGCAVGWLRSEGRAGLADVEAQGS